jgi:predicted AlkP superfamily phosphohydrolase/phosphomutase
MDTPDSATDYAYPPDLASELIRETGDHIHFIGPFLLDDMNAGRYGSAWDRIEKILEWRIKTVRYLLHSRDFDFFVVNFSATDAVQHHFWRFMDSDHPQFESEAAAEYGDCVYKVYKKLDAYTDEVWSGLDEDSVLVVMSDHGFGPASTRAVYLNNWLEQQGLLKPRNRMARSWWRRYIPEFAKRLGRQVLPSLYDKARAPLSPIFVDWGKTRAYADEYLQCVWINTVGRDPQGLVQPGHDYEELRNLIIEGLGSLHDPDSGLPVIGKVYRREDIYWGTHLDDAPDLQVEQRWEPFFQIRPSFTAPGSAPVSTLTSEQVLADRLLSGVHRPNGIFLATGAAIRPEKDVPGLRLIDLPATILHLLGVPVPACFDGRVLDEILNRPVPVEYTSEYDYESFIPQGRDNLYKGQGDEESIMERLRGLGYVD